MTVTGAVSGTRAVSSTAVSAELTLAAAAKLAAKTEFVASAETAEKLTRLHPEDLLGTPMAKLQRSEGAWKTEGGYSGFGGQPGALVAVKFPRPVNHVDGPFTMAFIDRENGELYLAKPEALKDFKDSSKLWGEESAELDVVGPVSVDSFPRDLHVSPVGAASSSRTTQTRSTTVQADSFAASGTKSAVLSSDAIARTARDYVLDRAGSGAGKIFPSVDSGNLGLSSFLVSSSKGEKLVEALKQSFPGLTSLQDFEFDSKEQRLLVVVTSDDEPQLHISVMNRRSGEAQFLGEVNSMELAFDSFGLGLEASAFDGLTELAEGGRWLELGEGSAPKNWWK